MAATTMVHVRVEGSVKHRAETALSAMGLTVSDAVRVFLTRVAAEQALPFAVRVPNRRTRAAMRELEQGGGRRHASVGSLLADLNADDPSLDRVSKGLPAGRGRSPRRPAPRDARPRARGARG